MDLSKIHFCHVKVNEGVEVADGHYHQLGCRKVPSHMQKTRSGLLVALAISTAGCNSHLYYDEGLDYKKADARADRTGRLSTLNECQRREMVLWEAGG